MIKSVLKAENFRAICGLEKHILHQTLILEIAFSRAKLAFVVQPLMEKLIFLDQHLRIAPYS